MTDTTAGEGVSPVYTAALDTLRKGAPGLSDTTRQALARSINMKVSLAAQPSAGAQGEVLWRHLTPSEAEHEDGCEHPKAPIWICDCPRPRPIATPAQPDTGLHPTTSDLIDRFAAALKDKLAKAEAKYGYTDEWSRDDWRGDLIWHLGNHVQKGDPRDVAAYCAFAWHHGWSITPPDTGDVAALRECLAAAIFDAGHTVSQRSWTDADVTEETREHYRRTVVDRRLARLAALSKPNAQGRVG